jgi:hypothetical protein
MSESDALPPRSPSRRRNIRRGGAQDRRAEAEARAQLPAVVAKPGPGAGASSNRAASTKAGLDQVSEFTAQLIGQDGAKRGLRGGPETLDKARGAYLGAEWSGGADRRPPTGRITKTDI